MKPRTLIGFAADGHGKLMPLAGTTGERSVGREPSSVYLFGFGRERVRQAAARRGAARRGAERRREGEGEDRERERRGWREGEEMMVMVMVVMVVMVVVVVVVMVVVGGVVEMWEGGDVSGGRAVDGVWAGATAVRASAQRV